MSMLSYALSVAGVWRLSRRMMRLRWALVATAFYGLNPNLLYLATTAMTETLFLALLVWSVVATMEGIAALRAEQASRASARMLVAGLLVLGMVFTRYDGWIIGAVAWSCFAWAMCKSESNVRRRVLPAFVICTVLCAAGPLLWFWYNQHFTGDWLDFLRGPYSAKQIERRTAPPGQHYREWHRPLRALIYFMRTAQVDAAAWETGFGLMTAALFGWWMTWKRRADAQVRARGEAFAWLLWAPLPFYVYSVAYGSVPIFIPQLYPHSYYNARYGMEMLPALSIYGTLTAERLDIWLRGKTEGWARIGARLWQSLAMVLCVVNCIAMMYWTPLVLKEGMVNARTRVSLEESLALELEQMPADEPVMMALSAHVGAVQTAGRTLRSIVSENDSQSFDAALKNPAHNAAFVIAIAGDPVARAVFEHPEGLTEIAVVCTTGQPCARVYQSQVWSLSPAGGQAGTAK
jgi:4-amino-4-deoxy-L-arabinose transferase-like glycosyltransferase